MLVESRRAGRARNEKGVERGPRRRYSLAFLCALALLPSPPGHARPAEAVLVPTEEDRWDADLRRAGEGIQRGDFAAAVQILLEVIEDAPASRALKAVSTSQPATVPSTVPSPAGEGAVAPPEEPGREEIEDFDPSAVGEVRLPPRKGVTLYLPVREVARQLLAGLPPEGVEVYRRLYGALAEDLYRKALSTGDRGLFQRLAEDYFLTEAGAEARHRLAEICFEDGRFWTAVSWWRRCAAAEAGVRELETRFKILAALRLLGEAREYSSEKAAFLSALRAVWPAAGAAGPPAEGGGPAQALEARLARFEETHPLVEDATAVAAAPGMPPGPPPRFSARRVGFDWNSMFWARKGIPRAGTVSRGVGDRRSAVILSLERETARAFPFFPSFAAFPPPPPPRGRGRFPPPRGQGAIST